MEMTHKSLDTGSSGGEQYSEGSHYPYLKCYDIRSDVERMNKVKYLPRFLILHTHMCENVMCMYVNVLGWVQGCSNYQHYDTLVHMVTPSTAMYQCVCNIISHHLMGISILMCYENQRVRFSFLFGLIWDFINKIWHIQPKTSISNLWHCIYLNQTQANIIVLWRCGIV